MPLVDEGILLAFDAALQCVGVAVLAILLIKLIRSNQWRNPLADLDFAPAGPNLAHVAGVFVAFYLLLLLLFDVVNVDSSTARIAGSRSWHVSSCLDSLAKLIVCGGVILLLPRFGQTHGGRGVQARPSRILLVSAAAVLVILPITALQLQMGQIVWWWLEPNAPQPVHVVLEALENTAWGRWGVVQLTLSAVVIAPLAEEVFFRGLLLPALWHHIGNVWLAILLSGAGFGLIHVQVPQSVLPLITMGVILGYVRVRYQSLGACVLIHAVFNSRTMALVLLNPEMVRNNW